MDSVQWGSETSALKHSHISAPASWPRSPLKVVSEDIDPKDVYGVKRER